MSLTSYRAAPPRDGGVWSVVHYRRRSDNCRLKTFGCCMDWKTWRRPTLPCLETQYHGRWGFSRPSSGRDRVRAPRQSHQVVQSMKRLSVFSRRSSGGWVLVCAVLSMIEVCGLTSGHWIGVDRAIRTGQLRALPRFHIRPINVMVYHGSRGVLVLR